MFNEDHNSNDDCDITHWNRNQMKKVSNWRGMPDGRMTMEWIMTAKTS